MAHVRAFNRSRNRPSETAEFIRGHKSSFRFAVFDNLNPTLLPPTADVQFKLLQFWPPTPSPHANPACRCPAAGNYQRDKTRRPWASTNLADHRRRTFRGTRPNRPPIGGAGRQGV